MPTYCFITEPKTIEIEQIKELYRQADWWSTACDLQPELITSIVSGSHCFLVAREEGAIIGMGRAISDRVNDAYIQDVTVTRARRREGIGGAIVDQLVARLQADGIAWVGLIAERNTDGFYSGRGFEKMPAAVPMLKRKTT
ncbi:MAG: GNAT family N-acetyltransferase [Smithellaceae bacterium]|nr:GNAT family N-acetyltransferase [Smithellaceae bacterium]